MYENETNKYRVYNIINEHDKTIFSVNVFPLK